MNAEYTAEHALGAWRAAEFGWGLFGIPERELGVLGEVAGLDVVERAAARRICRPGWRGGERGRSASTSRTPSC
jgi:hypothetical protein